MGTLSPYPDYPYAIPGPAAAIVPPALHARILDDLADPGASLESVARFHKLSLYQLSTWVALPEVRERMLAIEKAGYAHTRMAASLVLSSAVHVLGTMIEDYAAHRERQRALAAARAATAYDADDSPHYGSPSHLPPPRHAASAAASAFSPPSAPSSPIEIRYAENARRAAQQLYRLSRIVPIDDSRLARPQAASSLVSDVASLDAAPTNARTDALTGDQLPGDRLIGDRFDALPAADARASLTPPEPVLAESIRPEPAPHEPAPPAAEPSAHDNAPPAPTSRGSGASSQPITRSETPEPPVPSCPSRAPHPRRSMPAPGFAARDAPDVSRRLAAAAH